MHHAFELQATKPWHFGGLNLKGHHCLMVKGFNSLPSVVGGGIADGKPEALAIPAAPGPVMTKQDKT